MLPNLTIQPLFFLMVAVGVLVLPLHWFAGAMVAAVVHELCHIAAIYAVGGRVWGIAVGEMGTVIQTSRLSPGREWICALSGPAGSFLLVLLRRHFPTIAVCALVQGCFNLLPLYPLDGGRMLRCTIGLFCKDDAVDRIMYRMEFGMKFIIIVGAFYGAMVMKLGMAPVICALPILLRRSGEKNTLQTGERESTIGIPNIMR